MCDFFRRTSRSWCQIQSVEEMIQFTWWFWNPIRWPNLTQPDGLKPPMEAMDFFESSWDQMIRLPGSPTAPWWLEQMTPTYRGVKGFFDEHVSCECQKSSWWFTCLNSEGGRKLVWGWWDTLAYLSSEGTKFLFIIPFTRTIWTKGKSFRTPGETYINVQKPENASKGVPVLEFLWDFPPWSVSMAHLESMQLVCFIKPMYRHISARWRLHTVYHSTSFQSGCQLNPKGW